MLKVKKKIISLCALLVVFLQVFMPFTNQCYAISEETNIIENSVKNDTENINNTEENIVTDNKIENENVPKDTDNSSDNNIIQNETIENQEISENATPQENLVENEITEVEDNNELEIQNEMNGDAGISVASASGFGVGAGNENEFWNAFYNTGVSELTTSQVIRLNSTYTVNHNIRINSSSTSGGNALQLSSGCNIVVPNGCVLTLDGMVVDGRSWGNNDGKPCITVQSRWRLNVDRTFNY